jgi:hypothetical protein
VNRLFRRKRRGSGSDSLLERLSRKRKSPQRRLIAEELEPRLLLTTLTLPEGATGETIFVYSDPEENDPGEPAAIYNEIRIGTFSGQGPEKDVVVEILDYQANDIGGLYREATELDEGYLYGMYLSGIDLLGGYPGTISLFGGPSGGAIIEEVPPDQLGGLGYPIDALVTDSTGTTYGLTNGGLLVRIDTTLGTIDEIVGTVVDTNSDFTPFDVAYAGFESATFAKDSNGVDVLYAVVTAPTLFSALGQPIVDSYGSVLITIELESSDEDGVLIVEAEPVGRDSINRASYELSEVILPVVIDPEDPLSAVLTTTITTIVFSREGQNPTNGLTDEPVFLGFSPDNDTFVTISVDRADVGPDVTVTTIPLAAVDSEDAVVHGLMYDNQDQLFGLYDEGISDGGGVDSGKLVMVDLNAAPADRFIDVMDYGQNPNGDDIQLTGMSFDSLNTVGFATDPRSGTLYQLNVGRMELVEGDYIIQGLSDVFMVYVAESTADTYITFTRLDGSSDPMQYTPAQGDPAKLFIDDDDSLITTPDGAGGVMIGTIPQFIDDDEDIDWTASGVGTFWNSGQLAPPGPKGAYPGGEFRPGIIVAADSDGNPQNIGRIQVGGGVFGDVDINGSIDTFYAGYLGTNRFVVKGEINSLVVATEAGGVTESDGSWTSVNSPSVDVYGQMGSFYSNGNWGLPVRVHGRSDAPEFPGVLDIDTGLYVRTQRETERKYDNLGYTASGPYFMSGALDRADGTYIITNDSPYSAQYLGTVDGKMSVVGNVESADFDQEDYYSFGLMAGETVEIRLFDTGYTMIDTSGYTWINGHPMDPDSQVRIGFGVDLFDPELNWVANNGETDIVTGAPLPLTFTAEEAGIYTVAINGVFGNTKWWPIPYRLEVSGVSLTTLGGGNVLADMRSDSMEFFGSDIPGVHVISGNLGALSVGNYLRGSDIIVAQGDAAAIRAGANSLELNQLPLRFWDIAVPGPDSTSEMGFGWEIDDTPKNIPIGGQIVVGGNVGRISSPMKSNVEITVGGDLQSFRIGGEILAPEPAEEIAGLAPGGEDSSYTGTIAVDGNIGEIRIEGSYDLGGVTGELGTTWAMVNGGIFANADQMGAPGVIDSILVGGDFDGVVSVGEQGGNVRFVDIGGGISHSSGSWYEVGGFGPFSFDPGQSAIITDDSGVKVNISPGYTGPDDDELVFTPIGQQPGDEDEDEDDDDGTTDTDDTDDTDEEEAEGGILTVKLLPVLDLSPSEWLGDVNRRELGYAIVSIDSTDGIRVTSTGGPVEIGSITADGINDGSVVIGGYNPVSVMRITVPGPVVETIEEEDTDGGQTTPGFGDDEATVERIGISQVVNSSGYWEHLYHGRWVPGSGVSQRWVGGDIVSLQIGDSGAATNIAGVEDGEITLDDEDVNLTDYYIQTYPFSVVSVKGNLGLTYNTTGQVIKSRLMNEALDGDIGSDPGGEQHNGLVCEVGLNLLTVAGALGDVDVRSSVNVIDINNDNSSVVDQFDGVVGPIIVYGNLSLINLGDGLPAPGTGYEAESGVFVYGSLGLVAITGAGHDIGGPIFAVTEINAVRVTNGARITGYNAWGGEGERVRGSFAIKPTLNVCATFADFTLENPSSTVTSGPINSILVSGSGSEIRGAMLKASGIGSLMVTGGAEGIFDSRIYAFHTATSDMGYINQMYVGGDGIHNTVIAANRTLGTLYVLPGGTLEDSEIRGEYHIGTIIADEINRTDIDAINKLDRVTAYRGIFDLAIEAGEMGYLMAPEILGSAIIVGGPVSQIMTWGDMTSTIELTGPYGDLRYLYVGGDFGTPTGGLLSVDGKVGSIFVGGDFEAEIRLNWEPAGPGNPEGRQKYNYYGTELSSLMVMGRIVGFGDIGGDVGMIYGRGDFGIQGADFHVHGDLNTLIILGAGTPADLQSDVTVDGNLGLALVFGSVNGDINVSDNFGSLLMLGVGGERADLNGDITVGGNFRSLTIIGGDQNGNLTVEGTGPLVTIIGSDIDGTTIVGGGPGITIDGSITENGRYLSTSSIDTLHIKGNIDEGGVLYIDGDLGQLIVDGSIEGLVHVTGTIGTLRASDMGLTEGGLLATVTAAGDINTVNITNDMKDSYVLAGFDPGIGDTIVGIIDGSLTEEAQQLPEVIDSLWKELSVNGTLIDPAERALHGDIRSFNVNLLYNSVIAAGVSPGANNVFGDLDGSDMPGTGRSSIGTVIIGQTVSSIAGTPFGVFADTAISSLIVGGYYLPVPVMQSSGFHSWTLASIAQDDLGGFTFEAGRPFRGVITDEFDEQVDIMIFMAGAGNGQVLLREDGTGIEAIQLSETSSATTVQVIATGLATVEVGRIYNGDDESLNMLMIDGVLVDGNGQGSMDIGGSINYLKLGGVGEGTEVTIGGNVTTADLGTLSGSGQGSGAGAATIDIIGNVSYLQTGSVSDNVTITAGNVDSLFVWGDMDGVLLSEGDNLRSVMVLGDFDGVISSEGDIGNIYVSGVTGGGIRAAWNIGMFSTAGMFHGSVTAGGDFRYTVVIGDVEYSTLAAGLDVGPDGDPFSEVGVVSGRGDLGNVVILGDFNSSNIVAGVSPGTDGMFGTADDKLQERAVEEEEPPRIVGVEFGVSAAGTDFSTINVEFATYPQGRSSNIGYVHIIGDVGESIVPQEKYAIVSAGDISSVYAHQQAFSGNDTVARMTINSKDIVASSLAGDIETLEDALNSAFRIQTDGLDHKFVSFNPVIDNDGEFVRDVNGDIVFDETGDDILIFGDDVWVEFDADTNVASFHKTGGFTINRETTNYYKITLDASMIYNRQGAALDGEFEGQWPTGNGVSGDGSFEYFFAVGDLGDSALTAFAPFGVDNNDDFKAFPENTWWTYSSILGDSWQYDSSEAMLESDYLRFSDLEQGQILNINIEDRSAAYLPGGWAYYFDQSNLNVRIWQINEASNLAGGTGRYVIDDFGRNDLDPVRDVVAPNLDELAFGGGAFYGYDDQGQQFYKLDSSDLGVSLLANSLDDLNALSNVVSGSDAGQITHLRALTSHEGDSLWAVAEYKKLNGEYRESLILIQNISADADSAIQPSVYIAQEDLSDYFDNITALAEFNGQLYGIDNAANALVTIVSDPTHADYGKPTMVDALQDEFSNVLVDLNIVGLDVNPDGTTLLALHDQPANVFGSYLEDALYEIDPDTGVTELWQEFFDADIERSGLAIEPEGKIVYAEPLRGNPLGDTMKVTVNNETIEHTFGSDETVEFSDGLLLSLSSDPSDVNLLENELQQEFVDGGFYYVFNVDYSTELDDISVTISDIDWINDVDFGQIISVVTDDAVNVTTSFGLQFDIDTYEYEQFITLDISARDGDGDVKVYFAGAGMVSELGGADLELAGKVQGLQTRQDLDPARDTILPDLDEMSIASEILTTRTTVVLTEELEQALSDDLVEQLQIEVTGDLMTDVIEELSGHPNEPELISEFLDGLSMTEFNAVGYDSRQEIFALISTYNYDAMPIMVADPDDALQEVPLSMDVLTQIYQQSVDPRITFDEIRGLEFGRADDDSGTAINELWAVVSFSRLLDDVSGLSSNHDALLRIANIVDPVQDDISLSIIDLDASGFSNITELAYGNMPGNDPDNGKLYGYDTDTQTLLLLDNRLWVSNVGGDLIPNTNFGTAWPLGGADQVGNLTDPSGRSFNIVAMDFDNEGRLMAVEDTDNIMVEISTEAFVPGDNGRVELVQILPSDNVYRAMAFDSSYQENPFGFFFNVGGTTGEGFLVRMADGSPVGDEMDISVTKAGVVYSSDDSHTFYSDSQTGDPSVPTEVDTDNGSITVSSTYGNSSEDVAVEGGFYRFQIDYTTGQEEILVTIDNIDWNGKGNVDSVTTDDEEFVSVADFDENTLTLLIDTSSYLGERSVTIYFGATSDLQIPSTVQYAVSQVADYVSDSFNQESIEAALQIPEDGDYLVEIGSSYAYYQDLFVYYLGYYGLGFGFDSQGYPINYDMEVMLFDDGNSDFGITETTSGFAYDPMVPHNRPTDLSPTTVDVSPDPNYENIYRSDSAWPITVETQSFLDPGHAGEVVIDTQLTGMTDVDIYTFQLVEGQRVTVDIDSETLFGRDDVDVTIAIYNGDLEAVTAISMIGDDIASADEVDPHYSAQAVFSMPNHESVIIDPDENGLGTYYVVVNGQSIGVKNGIEQVLNENIPYRLTITTGDPEPVVTPPSQLVWLSFGDTRTDTNTRVDYLYEETDLGWSPDVANRPPFYAADFGLPETMRVELIEAIAERIEEIYRNAGLADDEIEFVIERPDPHAIYSTVVIGGRTPMLGLIGIAQSIDRGNSVRDDMATTFSEEIGLFYRGDGQIPLGPLSDDPEVRFDQAVTLVANTAAHELGHILGLEHATEVLTDEPNNLMGYNDSLIPQDLEERNLYWYQLNLGFTNEIDLLLRAIGSGTTMGE